MGIPPIFVISLKDASLRREHITNQLSALHCNFEFVEAVDGRKLTKEDLANYSSELALQIPSKWDHREMSNGEIACAMSHLNIYRKMLDEDISEAVILEDDAILFPGFVEVLQNRHLFPKDWMIVWLTHGSHYLFSRYGAATSFWGKRKIYGKYKLANFVEYPWTATAYLINKQTAKKLLNFAYPIRMPADLLATGNLGELSMNMYGIVPCCAAHDNSLPSLLAEERRTLADSQRPLIFSLLVRYGLYRFAKQLYLWIYTITVSPLIFLRQLGIIRNIRVSY